ncbi:MAG: undecaprenyldiphospho-muramoylpentapeptide beta-N-acetylglucosaminyltransferase [Elusimicrobiota bacterium]|jgi:UDP-N-acetylglucosamine--N-acetylmuramyl-(pentapeptide) pyrophosphoryl-undecaprenol N-acetylglucosamine transferase|nr:undecaprenyldiphospho-muramoylpentapeptide beta-N-acetylglucosaminyltransferase [Elusimicrobiota bacterium]
MKTVIIAASGTGGHIYPAISIGEEFRENNFNVVLFISKNPISLEIVKNTTFDYYAFKMSGFPKIMSFNLVKFFFQTSISFFKALRKIADLTPSAVIGTGGYIELPVFFAAKILRKKVFIHEQNSIPGKANKFLSRLADKIFLSFSFSSKFFDVKKANVCGYPIRKSIFSVGKPEALKYLNLDDKFTILVFGGSLGSTKLNEIALQAFSKISKDNDLQILHVTGQKDFDSISMKVGLNRRYKVFKYMHNMGAAYAISSVVICRSGAGAVFEIKALKKNAVLIPYPYACDNHQFYNAKEIEKPGEVVVIEEKYLSEQLLTETVFNLKKAESSKLSQRQDLSQKTIVEEIIKCLKY